MSKRRLRHGGSKRNKGTPYGGWIGYNEWRHEGRWKNVMPESWVVVGAPVVHRKTGHVATIAFVGSINHNPRHIDVAVYSDARHTVTSGPLSMRAFYDRWQRACVGCGKPMDVTCAACDAELFAEQMDVYRGMIGPLDPPVAQGGMDPYVRDDGHESTSAIRCGAVVDPYPSR